jgi:hypothetical protein
MGDRLSTRWSVQDAFPGMSSTMGHARRAVGRGGSLTLRTIKRAPASISNFEHEAGLLTGDGNQLAIAPADIAQAPPTSVPDAMATRCCRGANACLSAHQIFSRTTLNACPAIPIAKRAMGPTSINARNAPNGDRYNPAGGVYQPAVRPNSLTVSRLVFVAIRAVQVALGLARINASRVRVPLRCCVRANVWTRIATDHPPSSQDLEYVSRT